MVERLMKLKEASVMFGLPSKSLRQEAVEGRLKCYRARPGRTAPILLRASDIQIWLDKVASARVIVKGVMCRQAALRFDKTLCDDSGFPE